MKRFIIVSFVSLLILTGCSKDRLISNKIEAQNSYTLESAKDGFIKLKNSESITDSNESIKDLVNRYEGSMSLALSSGDVALVKSTIKGNSRLLEATELMVKYFFNEEIKQRLVSYEIKGIERLETKGKYRVNISEKLDIKYPGTNFYVYDYGWILEIDEINGNFVISDKKKWDVIEAVNSTEDANNTEDAVINGEKKAKNDLSLRRIPKVLPKNLNEDKTNMTKAAMASVKEYFEIDTDNFQIDKKVTGYHFSQGYGLLDIFKVYNQKISKIKEKKINRRINMVEIKYQEYHEETGFVEIVLKLSTEVSGVVNEEERKVRVNLMNMGNSVWYICDIENLPII